MNFDNRPLLSVSLITYNQKNFISQAIDSVLAQKTNFKYELIIGDDFSTDGTRELLKDYQNRYPEIIKLILHPQRNEGIPGKLNFISTIEAAKGKYIALLDGDDYWVDINKIQKQVSFLENNLDFVICFHAAYELHGEKKTLPEQQPKVETTYSIEDLASRNFLHTASVIFRNGLFEYPNWFFEAIAGDYVTHMFNARNGLIKYFPEPMAIYRVHESSVYGGKPLQFRIEKLLITLNHLIHDFEELPNVQSILKEQYASYCEQLAGIYKEQNNQEAYLEQLLIAFQMSKKFMQKWLDNKEAELHQLRYSKDQRIGKAILSPFRKAKQLLFKN